MNRQQRRASEKQSRKKHNIGLSDVLSNAIAFHKEGRLVEAENNYRTLLKLMPKQPDACHYLGLLLHQKGRSEEGIELIKKALDILPTYTDAQNNLGNIYKELGELDKAANCYRNVLESVPDYAPALNNLGIVMQKQGDYDEAVAILNKATELSPENFDFFQNLGNAYQKQGDFLQSVKAFHKSIALQPYQEDAYKNLWRAYYQATEFDEALGVLQQWLSFDPENPIALHTLAAHTGAGVIPERASDSYIQQTFDKFAGSFDEVLMRLEYRAPELVSMAVSHVYKASQNLKVLDAGCGTGLCGPLLKPYSTSLVGIDLSQKMLDKATGRLVYDNLIEAELVSYLEQNISAFDLIVSADTLVYFGDLKPFVHAAKNALFLGGHVIFTIEKMDDGKNYRLNHHGRYSHSKCYLETVVNEAGLTLCDAEEVILRKEAGEPVSGLLVTAKH
jgi:predicted TPR repeat methyltransferase